MSLLDDPFNLEQFGPPREKRTDRPLLVPSHDSAVCADCKLHEDGKMRHPYTRMSTLADFITSNHGLVIWDKRNLITGLSLREDLCGMAAALPPLNDAKRDKSTLTKAEKEQDKDTKAKLDDYIEQALETAGSHWKANSGTSVHGFIENGCSCRAPERIKPDVESALDLFDRVGIKSVASEVFTANDTLMAAGSFDHLAEVPGYGLVCIDVKTGNVDGKGLSFAIQLSGYMGGEVYDWRDDTRHPLESLTGGEKVNRNVGIVCHVPLGGARTQLYLLDLRLGHRAAVIATQVRAARQVKNLIKPLEL